MVAALEDTEEKRDCDEFLVKMVMILSGLNIKKLISILLLFWTEEKKSMNSRTIFPLVGYPRQPEEEEEED